MVIRDIIRSNPGWVSYSISLPSVVVTGFKSTRLQSLEVRQEVPEINRFRFRSVWAGFDSRTKYGEHG